MDDVDIVDILELVKLPEKADNFGASVSFLAVSSTRPGFESKFDDFRGKGGFVNTGLTFVCFKEANFNGLGTGVVLTGCSLSLGGCFSL